MTTAPATVRLAHISDVHVTVRRPGWRWRDLASKRVAGWINLKALGRGRRHRHADAILQAWSAEVKQRRPDTVVFSGDATCLGFASEFEFAAKRMRVRDPEFPPGVAVPGNHDYYTRASARLNVFEKEFAPWLAGERVDDSAYPFARRVGHLWLVMLNSSTANRAVWDASGGVGSPQCDRLARLLHQLSPGPRVLVTHYPVRLADGRPEMRFRELRDLAEVVKICNEGGVALWLHGHRHTPYFVAADGRVPFPQICAGSATRTGHGSYTELAITGRQLTARRRLFSMADNQFRDGESFELTLPE